MTTFQQWLKDIESEVESNILENRVYESYVHNVDYDADLDSFYIFRSEGKDEEINFRGKPAILLAPLKKIDLIPEKINLRFGGDWKNWFSDKSTYVHVSNVWLKAVAEVNKKIINTLTKDLREVDIKKSDYDGIDEATKMIVTHTYPDILLLNYIQLSILLKNKNFKHCSQLHPTLVEEKGNAFGGMFGSLSVYWNLGLSPDEGIIYGKKSSNLKMTTLDVGFDSYTEPKILHVNEILCAWFDNKDTAVKIKIV